LGEDGHLTLFINTQGCPNTDKKGVYSTGIKLFNNLPPIIESLNHNKRMLTPALKEYVLSHSYSVGEFTFTKNSELS
jgi:hypothetical protein